MFSFLTFYSASESCPINIMTRNPASAKHITVPQAVAEPDSDTGDSRRSMLARRHTLLYPFESALHSDQAQPSVSPLLSIFTNIKWPELNSRTIQQALNGQLCRRDTLHSQICATGCQASG